MKREEYIHYDAVGLAELIQKREVTAKELAAAAYAQLDQVQPELNVVTSSRKEKAFREAEKINLDARLAGVPTLLKNAGQTLSGEIASYGSQLLKDNQAEVESYFVSDLKKSGLQLLGTTNTPEFALKNITEPKLFGATRNPWNKNYSPGGSSGGAAAAVASGIVPVAGASDGGGSIRIPASFTGLVGLKPTRGKTAVGPGSGRIWHGAAINFMLTKSVRDTAALLDHTQVFQPEAAFHAPVYKGSYLEDLAHRTKKQLKFAYSTDSPVGTGVSDDAKQAVGRVLTWLQAAGHVVEEKDNGINGVELVKDYYLMNSAMMRSTILNLEKRIERKVTAQDLEIESWLLQTAGKTISATDFSASLEAWDEAAAQMVTLHESYDFYITPTTAYSAPKIGEFEQSDDVKAAWIKKIAEVDQDAQQQMIYDMFLPSLTYTPFGMLANLTGQPAITLPVYLSEAGLPIGVQILANKGEDHRLLQLAYEMEQSDLWVGLQGNPYFKGD